MMSDQITHGGRPPLRTQKPSTIERMRSSHPQPLGSAHVMQPGRDDQQRPLIWLDAGRQELRSRSHTNAVPNARLIIEQEKSRQ